MRKDGRWPMWVAQRPALMLEYNLRKYDPEFMREADDYGLFVSRMIESAQAGKEAGESLRNMMIIDHQPAHAEQVLKTASMICSIYPEVDIDAAVLFLTTEYKAGVSSLEEIMKSFSDLKTTES